MTPEEIRERTAGRINWDLIDKTIINIEEGIAGFDMGTWWRVRGDLPVRDQENARNLYNHTGQVELCNTAMCFAGWVAHTVGARLSHPDGVSCELDGVVRDIPHLAREQLGLTSVEIGIFSGGALPGEMHAPTTTEELVQRIYRVVEERLVEEAE